jgi:anion-transporting  ArsA/GET3 family ATPase
LEVRVDRSMSDLFEKRFVVVAGKGGVGRTTVSLLIGRCAAARGKRTLVCLVSAPPRYQEILGGLAIGKEARLIAPGLHVVNLDPVSAREEYGLMILKSPALHRLVFGSRIVRAFLDAVPGLAEWAMLGKATYHALRRVGGRPEYDLVVFDSPATGHGLDVLSLPAAIVASVPAGRIRDEALERVRLMGDPRLCEVVPVTLPEEMPVSEVLELIRGLGRHRLPMERIAVNMVDDARPPDEIAALVDRAREDWDRDPWLVPAAAAVAKWRAQEESLARVASASGLELIALPAVKGRGLDEAGFARLARELERQLSPGARGAAEG